MRNSSRPRSLCGCGHEAPRTGSSSVGGPRRKSSQPDGQTPPTQGDGEAGSCSKGRTGEIAASAPGQTPSAMTTRSARRGALYPRLATVLARQAHLCCATGAARRPTGSPTRRWPGDGRVGLTPRDGGKSHPPTGATQPHQCKCQGSGQRNVLPGQPTTGPSWCSPQRVMPATPPGAGARSRLSERGIVLLRCCILPLYQALELWAQDFESISLTWVELKGFEPLTSCMPFLAEPSGDVEVSLGLAGQSGYSVWLRPGCVRSRLCA
jgi:hypothetical protein